MAIRLDLLLIIPAFLFPLRPFCRRLTSPYYRTDGRTQRDSCPCTINDAPDSPDSVDHIAHSRHDYEPAECSARGAQERYPRHRSRHPGCPPALVRLSLEICAVTIGANGHRAVYSNYAVTGELLMRINTATLTIRGLTSASRSAVPCCLEAPVIHRATVLVTCLLLARVRRTLGCIGPSRHPTDDLLRHSPR